MQEQGAGISPSLRRGERIGLALRQLRLGRGWSIATLARASGVSRAHISRLERGYHLPRPRTLARLAHAFGIDPAGLTSDRLEAPDASRMDSELAGCLEFLAVPRATWDEFARLTDQARQALISLAQTAGTRRQRRPVPEQALRELVLAEGVEAATPALLDAVYEYGMPPVGNAQAWVQFEELAGDRLILLARLPTVPTACGFDQIHLFRAVFAADPPDPMLLKWWTTARRTAIHANLRGYQSRTILDRPRIERYIETGEWAPGITIPRDIVRRHVRATAAMLRAQPSYRIGLIADSPELLILVKGSSTALIAPPDTTGASHPAGAGAAGTMLRFTHPDMVDAFRRHLGAIWESIDEEWKDSRSVASWLEARI